MRSKHRLDARGYMLLESLVALGLLAIGMTSLSGLMVTHLRAAGSNNLLTTAIALGEQELEDIRSQDYTAIVSRTTTSTLGNTTYTIATTVTADSPALNMKTISTNVTWSGLNGAQTYALKTIYTQIQK
jgi:Tfp pilus assembly protein PilV